MGAPSESRACLRITGDELIPDEITVLLGCGPTVSDEKGKPKHIPYQSGRVVISNSGSWRLHCEPKIPGDLNGQIKEILQQLTHNFTVWHNLAEKYDVHMFCGRFLDTFNEGTSLSTETLKSLSERHIYIDFDMYYFGDEEE